MPSQTANALGTYLKTRRVRLDPAVFGFPAGPQADLRAASRGGRPARQHQPDVVHMARAGAGRRALADVLNRIAAALLLTDVEREHLFLIGLGRPPEVRYTAADGVTPRLQRVLDALEFSPALVKTATWDVVAWNRAAAAVLVDYGALPTGQRNILRLMFGNAQARAAHQDWESLARFAVGAFRADAARAGAVSEVSQLVDELCRLSPGIRIAVARKRRRRPGAGVKRLRHPILGPIDLEYSSFAVDGRPDLTMNVFNPIASRDLEIIRSLVASRLNSA